MTNVSFDRRSLIIDGRRILLFSGAVHYPRSTPALWEPIFRRARAAGLNAIETYVFWNLHERRRGVFDFSGRLDLARFCALAAQHGLHVVLRIGPYICAEIDYGGFPAWLRDVPGLAFRTDNEPYKTEMARWVKLLCEYLRPMFAPVGGPIILAQIENEYFLVDRTYGQAGQKYLRWAGELADSLNLGIPWIMCEGAAPGAIETLNGFFVHGRLGDHQAKHPDQPALWTEHWTGWYDTWGHPHHVRDPRTLAYGAAHFIANCGTGVNYYMWHGGTNFGREAMYLQTTSYDYDAPLDEFSLETTKSNHLARLHRVLNENAALLLQTAHPQMQKFGAHQYVYTYGQHEAALIFFCNDDSQNAATVRLNGIICELPPRSAKIYRADRLVFDTSVIDPTDVIARSMHPLDGALSPFQVVAESLPTVRRGGRVHPTPIEQLQLTHDESDYCWYTTRLTIPGDQPIRATLQLRGVADVVHVFLDGKFKATSRTPLLEARGPLDAEGFHQTFKLRLAPGEHELQILCCAIGLIKGDWLIGHRNMNEEKKGIWGTVLFNDSPLPGPWTMHPCLAGELQNLPGPAGDLARWKPTPRRARPLSWLRARFERPAGDAPLALDLASMHKGMAWINGHCLGRYWLVTSRKEPFDDWQADGGLLAENIGQPTQRYYHIPPDWLEDQNTLVLFEELGGDPGAVRLCQWK